MKEKVIDGCVVVVVIASFFWAIADPQESSAFTAPDVPTPQDYVDAVDIWSDTKLNELLAAQQQTNATLIDHTARLEQIESSVLHPEPEPEQEEAVVVRLYTADESWSCSPCNMQQQQLRNNNPSFQYETIKGPRDGRPPGRNVYPTWEIVRPDGTTTVVHGVRSVAALEQLVDADK